MQLLFGLGEHAPCNGYCRVRRRPACIESEVNDELDQFVLRDAVLQGPLQVEGQLIRAVERDERRDGDQAPVARRQAGALPDVAKLHLVGVFAERVGVASLTTVDAPAHERDDRKPPESAPSSSPTAVASLPHGCYLQPAPDAWRPGLYRPPRRT